MKEEYVHPRLGPVTINKSSRARRLSIVVRSTGITLTVPHRMAVKEAVKFLDVKIEWVQKAVERNRRKAKPTVAILPPFQTRLHRLELLPGEGTRFEIHVRNGVISVVYPALLGPESEAVQKVIKKGVAEAYRIEAKTLLPGRVAYLAGQHGFRCNAVTVRNSVSRWGSCSAGGRISLSLHLMTLPDHLIDYVILHELCHTVHKNHGPRFHALLDKVTQGRHRDYRIELRQYTTRW